MRVPCPFCGKAFSSIDEDGCIIKEYKLCQDYIGSGVDEGYYGFDKGFEVLDEIWRYYREIDELNDVHKYLCNVMGAEIELGLQRSEFFDKWPEIRTESFEWDGGMARNGLYCYVAVERKSQAAFLEKLQPIRNRLEIFASVMKLENSVMANWITIPRKGTNLFVMAEQQKSLPRQNPNLPPIKPGQTEFDRNEEVLDKALRETYPELYEHQPKAEPASEEDWEQFNQNERGLEAMLRKYHPELYPGEPKALEPATPEAWEMFRKMDEILIRYLRAIHPELFK